MVQQFLFGFINNPNYHWFANFKLCVIPVIADKEISVPKTELG